MFCLFACLFFFCYFSKKKLGKKIGESEAISVWSFISEATEKVSRSPSDWFSVNQSEATSLSLDFRRRRRRRRRLSSTHEVVFTEFLPGRQVVLDSEETEKSMDTMKAQRSDTERRGFDRFDWARRNRIRAILALRWIATASRA